MTLARHMPFLTEDERGGAVLLHCRAGTPPPDRARAWKLWVASADGDRRVETGLGEEVVECSPAGWRDASGWHLSFIAGGAAGNPLFRLWRMDGPSLDDLGKPVFVYAPTNAGFVHGDKIVYAIPHDRFAIRRRAGLLLYQWPGATILRITYRADSPGQLLVSGRVGDDDLCTIEFDILSGRQSWLICDGRPAYKPTVYRERTLHARREGPGFEDRAIEEATTIERRPADALERIIVRRG